MSGPLTADEREQVAVAMAERRILPWDCRDWRTCEHAEGCFVALANYLAPVVAAIADARAQAAVEAERERIAYALDTHGDEAWFDLTGVRTYEEAISMKGAYHHAAAVAGGLEPCLDEHADCRGVE